MKFIEKYNWFIQKSGVDYKQFQYEGVKWCYDKEVMKVNEDGFLPVNGGIVADEMGLGKTIMMISLFVMNVMPRTLIVLPNILIEQWRSEIFKFIGHNCLIYYGKNKKTISIDDLNNAKIVLTSYHNISKHSTGVLHEINWNRVVFDEAHHLRNRNNMYLGSLMLKFKICWLISGTPVQNKKVDFFNLCDVLNIPSSMYKKETDTIINNYILRRTKKSVGILLPDLILNNQEVQCKSTPEKKLSQDIHSIINRPGIPGCIKMSMYIKAKQVCILPRLLKNHIYNMTNENMISKNHLLTDLTKLNSKMDTVTSVILSNKNNGNGKLIFCHFHEEMDEIKKRLVEGGIEKVCLFDGRISMSTRNANIVGDYEVIILQIQTGCEGLNLQKNFNEIYFVSPNWNPSIEDQAIARCYRIGQLKEVVVYRFNMGTHLKKFESNKEEKEEFCDSSDNHILKIQNIKRGITKEIIRI
jgi:SNF2 family DNA or RNA helicase